MLGILLAAGVLTSNLSAVQMDAGPAKREALARIREQQFQAAADMVQAALQKNSRDVDLWNLLGISETELHKTSAAAAAFDRGLAIVPDSVSLHENMGLLYFRDGDYARAKKYLGRAVQLGSANPTVRFSLAEAQLRTGDRDAALIALTQLQPALAGYPEYWVELARADLPDDARRSGRRFCARAGARPEQCRRAQRVGYASPRDRGRMRRLWRS